ncbi:hypothetical protein [Acidaminobacter sp. JC074]|nr:hypothetical protein [Acidaminobacter sp. JC074]
MKVRDLTKLLGIKSRFNYESSLYNDTSINSQKDFLEENKVPTREGHLD